MVLLRNVCILISLRHASIYIYVYIYVWYIFIQKTSSVCHEQMSGFWITFPFNFGPLRVPIIFKDRHFVPEFRTRFSQFVVNAFDTNDFEKFPSCTYNIILSVVMAMGKNSTCNKITVSKISRFLNSNARIRF